MATIELRYSPPTLPTAADRNFDAGIGNWLSAGNHTGTASATYCVSSPNSLKIVASGVGDFTTNNVYLPSASNTTFVVGQGYCISFYARGDANESWRINTGGYTFANFTPSASAFGLHTFYFVAVTATTDFQIAVITGADTIYIDNIVVQKAVSLTVLAEHGMSDPDSFDFFPALQKTFLDGTMKEYIKGFRRKILVDVGVVAASADRKRILYWMCDNDRTVDYLTEINVPLALQDVGGFENEWKFDCSLNRYFVFALQEPSIRTTFPV
jgi:hypothetical protein